MDRNHESAQESEDVAPVELAEISPTIWRYDYVENDQNVYEWKEMRQSDDLADLLPVPQLTQARILLLEGWTEEVIDRCYSQLGVPKEFFAYHNIDSVRTRPVSSTTTKTCLSVKLSRLVDQTARHWQIESSILKGNPYKVNTFKDPADLKLDHERYQRVPAQSRPYCLISQTQGGIVQLAARESISVLWIQDTPSLVALVVVDPKREYSITEKRYRLWGTELKEISYKELCFQNEDKSHARIQFVQELTKQQQQTLRHGFVHDLQVIIAHIMVANTTKVLASIHGALDNIDLSLSRDEILRSSLHIWREHFGLWRQEVLYSLLSVKDTLYTFEQQKLCPTCESQPSANIIPNYEINLMRLKCDLDDTLERLSSTFQTVMSTMSIVESQKAISEAETVSKLTALAFFFIPLSFIASLIGMNLVEFDQKLKIWMWVTVSVGTIILTYSFLFLGTITRIIRHREQFKQNFNARWLSAGAMRLSRILIFDILPSTATALLLLAVGAESGVGFWKLYTSDLSTKAKIATSIPTWSLIVVAVLCFGLPMSKIPSAPSASASEVRCLHHYDFPY